MIYFAQAIDGGAVKIGCSVNVEVRLRQLEAHYGRPLALLATMPGGREEEQAVHERFDHLRLGNRRRRRVEQFRPAPDLMAFIGRPLLVIANPDAVEAMAPHLGGRDAGTTIMMTSTFKAWLQRYANHRNMTITETMVQAVIDDAKDKDFEEGAPKR